jgi:hypothetical protein
MLSLLTEWNDAPGVKDPALAATWARLEIKHESPSGTQWLSRLIRSTANSLDRGVYGSLFPLAEWIVENWWFLLYESCRVPEFVSGRRLATDPAQRAWLQRHNLLAAQGGGALPDVTLFRDGNSLVVQWAPDPEHDEHVRPVRFIEQGTVFAAPSEVEHSLHHFVEAVLSRLTGCADRSTNRLRTEWAAVCESRHNESALCARSAAMGLDPYDDRELTEDLVELLESRVSGLQAELERDLLEATNGGSLAADLDWLDQALSHVSNGLAAGRGCGKMGLAPSGNGENPGKSAVAKVPVPVFSQPRSAASGTEATTAHQLGYQRAALFRRQFSVSPDPVFDLSAMLHERCGWSVPGRQTVMIDGVTNVSALVAVGGDRRPCVVGPSLGHWAERFRLARALYFLPDASQPWRPRLVTRAYTWDQRASRAFAAELLAPAEALRAQLGSVVSADDVDHLARQFDVRPSLVEHQIRNHRLAWLDED